MRFSQYDGKKILDGDTKKPLVDGDHPMDFGIIRTIGGYLDGGDDAAIDTYDGYREYRRKSVLHREGGPAVVYLSDPTRNEFWENGVKIK
jgi:hypothetical protein